MMFTLVSTGVILRIILPRIVSKTPGFAYRLEGRFLIYCNLGYYPLYLGYGSYSSQHLNKSILGHSQHALLYGLF